MDIISIDNISKLKSMGFTEKDAIKALNLKKSVPLAAHWLSGQRITNNSPSNNRFTSQNNSLLITNQNSHEKIHHTNQTIVEIPEKSFTPIVESFEGEIKYLDEEKSFGFISFDDNDIFFHYSDKKNPMEILTLGEEVLFSIGENRNPGKNMGRLCAKNVHCKNSLKSSEISSKINSTKRLGIVTVKKNEYGLIKDKQTQKTHVFYYNDDKDYKNYEIGDHILFYIEVSKQKGFITSNAIQLEQIPKTTVQNSHNLNLTKTADLSKSFFYRRDAYPDDESRSVEFKAMTKTNNVIQRILETTEKYLVAFLNAQGGRIFYGILDTGIIIGLKMQRRLRDEIRLGIDSLVAQITPAVTNDLYQVIFYPVFDRSIRIDDFYVLCVECKKGKDIYVDSKHNAWIRREGSVRTMNIAMAKVLWHNRLEENRRKMDYGGGTSTEDLQRIIKNVVSSELKKVAGIKVAEEPNNINNDVKTNDVFLEGTRSSPIKIIGGANSKKSSKTKENKENLIDLEGLTGFDKFGVEAFDPICILDEPVEKDYKMKDEGKLLDKVENTLEKTLNFELDNFQSNNEIKEVNNKQDKKNRKKKKSGEKW